jgi:LacI family transcriptional regulator
MGVVMALTRAHRRDIAVVGFDDFTFADLFEPGITVVAQDAEQLGAAAAELVLSRLDGDRTKARTTVLPTQLIARGSGELAVPTDARSANGARR